MPYNEIKIKGLITRDGEKDGYGSILEALEEQFVLVINRDNDSTVTMIDGCDRVFWVDLNKEQMQLLSDEIGQIAESMK